MTPQGDLDRDTALLERLLGSVLVEQEGRAFRDRVLWLRDRAAALRAVEDDLRETLTVWWQTDDVRALRPRPDDEVRRTLLHVESVLYDAVPDLLLELSRTLGLAWPLEGTAPAHPASAHPPSDAERAPRVPIRFGSWAGGDMDGNPNVGPDTIAATLVRHRRTALRLLGERVDQLAVHFSQSGDRVFVTQELRVSLERDARELPRVTFPGASANEPFRRKLTFVAALGRPPGLSEAVEDEEAAATIAGIAAVGRAVEEHGPDAIGRLIIAMARQPSDVLGTLFLLRHTSETGSVPPVPIVPLFETVEDLQAAESTMGDLYATAPYAEHVERCGGAQEIMLGYSDSAKDGGFIASQWGLYVAQERLVAQADARGIAVRFFHGRAARRHAAAARTTGRSSRSRPDRSAVGSRSPSRGRCCRSATRTASWRCARWSRRSRRSCWRRSRRRPSRLRSTGRSSTS